MSNELKPCPFCGSRDVRSSVTINRVICNECGASGPMAMNESDAKEKWNKPPREDEVVELPRDADGVPICVGDTVYDKNYGAELIVMSLCLSNAPWTANCRDSAGTHCTGFPQSLTHVKPDSPEAVEKSIRELIELSEEDALSEIPSLMERIKKLTKGAE